MPLIKLLLRSIKGFSLPTKKIAIIMATDCNESNPMSRVNNISLSGLCQMLLPKQPPTLQEQLDEVNRRIVHERVNIRALDEEYLYFKKHGKDGPKKEQKDKEENTEVARYVTQSMAIRKHRDIEQQKQQQLALIVLHMQNQATSTAQQLTQMNKESTSTQCQTKNRYNDSINDNDNRNRQRDDRYHSKNIHNNNDRRARQSKYMRNPLRL